MYKQKLYYCFLSFLLFQELQCHNSYNNGFLLVSGFAIPITTTTSPAKSLVVVKDSSSSSADSSAPTSEKNTEKKKKKHNNDAFIHNSFLENSPRKPTAAAAATTIASECDNMNDPPSLSVLLGNINELTLETTGSDIRGTFVDHSKIVGSSIMNVVNAILNKKSLASNHKIPALTPLSTYCFGYAFGQMIVDQKKKQQQQQQQQQVEQTTKTQQYPANDFYAAFHNEEKEHLQKEVITVAIGQDPRPHGAILCDAFSRGVLNFKSNEYDIRVVYTGIATTPSMNSFMCSGLCDGAVMVTASHLPIDRNGLKMFTKFNDGGLSNDDVHKIGNLAKNHIKFWYDKGTLPAFTSGFNSVYCSEYVDFLPHYANDLKKGVISQLLQKDEDNDLSSSSSSKEEEKEEKKEQKPLHGVKIILNSGNGSGGFFNNVLSELGADVSDSIHVKYDSTFPNGIPNPENSKMVEETIQACQKANADIGIMLDTDADRCGFVAKSSSSGGRESDYEPINKNRLIALLSVMFANTTPNKKNHHKEENNSSSSSDNNNNVYIVTDSTTSEGLTKFINNKLGLHHVRYLRGYANVINKAKELTYQQNKNAVMGIETSGHCAMKENYYLDDGIYTAAKVVGLLAKLKKKNNDNEGSSSSDVNNLLHLIQDLEELPVVSELRVNVNDGSVSKMRQIFDLIVSDIQTLCSSSSSSSTWKIDNDNLEGIRVRFSSSSSNSESDNDGSFFMLRKSLHDPVISMQVEGHSTQDIQNTVMKPLMEIFQANQMIIEELNISSITEYLASKE